MLVDPDVMCLICSEHVLLQDSYQFEYCLHYRVCHMFV